MDLSGGCLSHASRDRATQPDAGAMAADLQANGNILL